MFESSHTAIKHWAKEDQPREKMMRLGRHHLSDSELIAILLKSGTTNESALDLSQMILSRYNDDLSELGKSQIDELMQFKGIGPTKAITLLAAMELGRRRQQITGNHKPILTTSRACYEILGPQLADLPHEEFWVIFLNRANKFLGKECISKGGVSGTLVDCKMIFRKAISKTASSLILMHNHPSGNPSPSDMDLRLTRKIIKAAQLLDIRVLDHLIIAANTYTSFADEGLMSQ